MRPLGIILLTLLLSTSLMAQEMSADEIDYKANFIVKLLQYVEWPAGADKDASGAISIGVQGDSPLTPVLETLAADGAKDGTPINVKTVAIGADIADCQILFISSKETSDLAKILKAVAGKPVLTVSDCEYFARYGVMLNFYKDGDKVKFEHNRRTTKEAGLKVSSRLLKMATII